MADWTKQELSKMETAEEIRIAGQRADDTLLKPVIIWVVRIDDDLYVRSYKGPGSGWFRGIEIRHTGRIWAGGLEKDVNFLEESGSEINVRVDAAYRTKYRRYEASIVDSMVTPPARATTIRLVPR